MDTLQYITHFYEMHWLKTDASENSRSSSQIMHSLTLGVDGLLVGELLKNLGGSGQTIAGLADAAVDNQLINLEVAHDVSTCHGAESLLCLARIVWLRQWLSPGALADFIADAYMRIILK